MAERHVAATTAAMSSATRKSPPQMRAYERDQPHIGEGLAKAVASALPVYTATIGVSDLPVSSGANER